MSCLGVPVGVPDRTPGARFRRMLRIRSERLAVGQSGPTDQAPTVAGSSFRQRSAGAGCLRRSVDSIVRCRAGEIADRHRV